MVQLAVVLSLLLAVLLAPAIYEEVTCKVVASDEEAIAITKAWMPKNGMWHLGTVTGDWRSNPTRGDLLPLFEKSVRGEFGSCNAAPPQFHYAGEWQPDRDGTRWVRWVSCEGNFVASASVSRCGRVYDFRVDDLPPETTQR